MYSMFKKIKDGSVEKGTFWYSYLNFKHFLSKANVNTCLIIWLRFFFGLTKPNAENPQIWKSLVLYFHGMCPILYSTLPYVNGKQSDVYNDLLVHD